MKKAQKHQSSHSAAYSITVSRNARTGQYVTHRYAKNHPRSTETERNSDSNVEKIVTDGVKKIIKSTEKQIGDIDRLTIKYGL